MLLFKTKEVFKIKPINERVKHIRECTGLSQKAFAEKMGFSRDVISNIEYDRTDVKEYVIKALCREFNVNRAWLVDGIGDDMFLTQDMQATALFDHIMAGENETAKALFKTLAELSDSEWEVIRKVMAEINKNIRDNKKDQL